MTTTTIKVDAQVRDRLRALARDRGITLNQLLDSLLRDREREERFEGLRRDIAATSPEDRASYAEELEAWDVTLADGLPEE